MTPPRPVVSVELTLDAHTEAVVRGAWRRLADAGLSSLAAHDAPSNRPHITLLVRTSLDERDFGAAVAQLPIAVRWTTCLTFDHGDRVVLAYRVDPDAALERLHREVHDAAGEGDDLPHTAPGAWTPHVTLARRLKRDRLDEALSLVEEHHVGSAVALRRWDAASATVTALR